MLQKTAEHTALPKAWGAQAGVDSRLHAHSSCAPQMWFVLSSLQEPTHPAPFICSFGSYRIVSCDSGAKVFTYASQNDGMIHPPHCVKWNSWYDFCALRGQYSIKGTGLPFTSQVGKGPGQLLPKLTGLISGRVEARVDSQSTEKWGELQQLRTLRLGGWGSTWQVCAQGGDYKEVILAFANHRREKSFCFWKLLSLL